MLFELTLVVCMSHVTLNPAHPVSESRARDLRGKGGGAIGLDPKLHNKYNIMFIHMIERRGINSARYDCKKKYF